MTTKASLHPLDNPVWQSLSTCHSRFALGDNFVKRYPQDIGPFVAVSDKEVPAESQLEHLVAVNESVYFIGVAPSFNFHWTIERQASLLQMICESRIENIETDVEVSSLTQSDNPVMIEL